VESRVRFYAPYSWRLYGVFRPGQLIVKRVIKAGYDSSITSTIWSGRPLRALRNAYLEDWEENRQDEIKELSAKGIVPLEHELERLHEKGELTEEIEDAAALRYVVFTCRAGKRMMRENLYIWIRTNGWNRPIGIVAGSVNKPGQTGGEIVDEIVRETVIALKNAGGFLNPSVKL